MADYGIKVTKPGKDITSADEQDYVLWSKYFFMKTFMVGTYSYTFPSDLSTVSIDITHSEGERKAIWLSIEGANATEKTIGRWVYYYESGGDKALRWWDGRGEDNKLTIYYGESNTAGSGYNPTSETWDFKYYIFVEKLN